MCILSALRTSLFDGEAGEEGKKKKRGRRKDASDLNLLQDPQDVVVLGGPAAVSATVLEQLEEITGAGVARLSGGNRYATAAAVVQRYWPGSTPRVYLATGRDHPDALAGVPAAGRDSAPLLLVEPTCMPLETEQQLARLEPSTVVVLGGTATVSEAAITGRTICP